MGQPKIVIVRRGHFATFELLSRTFAGDPLVRIIWDRRTHERRQSTSDVGERDRRRRDRRSKPPEQWGQLNYIIAGAHPA